MPISTFMGLETALRGILAQQRGLDVTSHNIANANTTGYTRQRADLVATPAYTYPAVSRPPQAGQIGTGVEVADYVRIRDQFVDVQLRTQLARKGYADTREDGLNQVELAVNEPSDTGVADLLNKYWSAWNDLSNNPENMAARQALAQSGAALADGLNSLTSQLSTITTQTGQNIGMTVDQVNQLGANLADLNKAIFEREAVGDTPNDLLDARDNLLDQLSSIGSVVSSDPDGNGSLTVTLNGVTLVDESTAYTLSESGGNLVNGTLGQTQPLAGRQGSLAAMVDLRDTTLPGYQASLDTIASALITNTNSLQAAGFDLQGNSGATNGSAGQLFQGTDAATIAFNPAVLSDPSLIAASGNGQPGNADTALAQVALRTTSVIGPSTIDTAYAQLVSTIGSDSQQAQNTQSNAEVLANSLENRRESISGVSLDEEMVNLVKYQRAYQASARALSAMDDMVELLVTRTGRVGL